MAVQRRERTPELAPRRTPTEASPEWKNIDEVCERDKIQVIVNNSMGKEKEASLLVENRGECPMLVGTAPQREDFSHGKNQEIPKGRERVHVTIPAGHFLMAECQAVPGAKKCDWTISDVES